MKYCYVIPLISLAIAATAIAAPPGSTNLVIPTIIASDPPVFMKNRPVNFSATFAAPQKLIVCQGASLGLRIHDVEPNMGEPTAKQSFLAGAMSNYKFDALPGTKASAKFEPVSVPAFASATIYVDVWRFCTIKSPRGIDPDTVTTINNQQAIGQLIGGEIFKLHCTGKTPKTSVCVYKKDGT